MIRSNIWGKKQQNPAAVFSRSSIAFLDGVQYAANICRKKTVAFVSATDGAIPSAEGDGGEVVVPQGMIGAVMYGLGAATYKLYKTTDGVSWSRSGLSDLDVNGSVYFTNSGTILRVSSDSKKMFRSIDGGVNFVEVTSPNWVPSASSSWNTPWMFADHHGVLMLGEYGAASSLAGRYLHKSNDEGATWSVAYDLNSQTAKPYHWHTVAYHEGSGKWVAAFGDTRAYRGIVTSHDGTTWTKLYTEGTGPDQPVCFYDYGDPVWILFGDDGAACIGKLNVYTGQIQTVFTETNRQDNQFYCWTIFAHAGVYYAGSMDTSGSGAAQAVLWVSTDRVNWSVYHRFDTAELVGFYRYAGYIGGKLHFDVASAATRNHFMISPASVRNVGGVLIEPANTNLKTTTSSSSNESTSDWTSGSTNWTGSRVTSEHLHGVAAAKFVGISGDANTKNVYASNVTLGDAGADKKYVITLYAKAESGQHHPGQVNLRTSGGSSLTPNIVTQFVLDDQWQKIVCAPVTIPKAAPAAYRVYVSIIQGSTAATVYIDCLQIQEAPLTEWQVGGTAKTADVLTETVAAPFEWTDLFAVQTRGLHTHYTTGTAKHYIKTWKVGSDEIQLYFDSADAKFYIQRNAESAVGSAENFWAPNAVLKFALRADASGLTLDIQNGRAKEQITDSALAAVLNASLTMIYGDVSSANQFPGVYFDDAVYSDEDVSTQRRQELGFGFIPFKLSDAEVSAAFNLTPIAVPILSL